MLERECVYTIDWSQVSLNEHVCLLMVTAVQPFAEHSTSEAQHFEPDVIGLDGYINMPTLGFPYMEGN